MKKYNIRGKEVPEGITLLILDYINELVYFGEMTFYHMGAIVPFETKEWEEKIGDWLVLPEKTANIINVFKKGLCGAQEHLALNEGLDEWLVQKVQR